MRRELRIDVLGFTFIGIALLAMGILYSLSDTIMPYHLDAMSTTWEELSSGSKVMTLNYMKSAAAGFMAYGVFTIVIAWIPLRRDEIWSLFLLLAGLILEVANVLYRTYSVSKFTPANPPFLPLVILVVIGFVSFSFGVKRVFREKAKKNASVSL